MEKTISTFWMVDSEDKFKDVMYLNKKKKKKWYYSIGTWKMDKNSRGLLGEVQN